MFTVFSRSVLSSFIFPLWVTTVWDTYPGTGSVFLSTRGSTVRCRMGVRSAPVAVSFPGMFIVVSGLSALRIVFL